MSSIITIILNAQSFAQLRAYADCLGSIAQDHILTDASIRIVIKGLFNIIDQRNRAGWFKAYQELLSIFYFNVSHATYSMNQPLTNIEIILYDECGWDPLLDSKVMDIYCTSEQEWESINRARKDHGISLAKFHKLSDIALLDQSKIDSSDPMNEIFQHVVVGGTFDHLHVGHKILLTMAAFVTQDKLTVGVMDAPIERLQKKRAYEYMESLQVRINNVEAFLEKVNQNLEYHVIPIYDDYGPTITDESIQALVGSLETYNGCKAVNEERAKIGFHPLELFTIDVISSTESALIYSNMQDKISSSYIREYISRSRQNLLNQ